jgi:hypothetical protein
MSQNVLTDPSGNFDMAAELPPSKLRFQHRPQSCNVRAISTDYIARPSLGLCQDKTSNVTVKQTILWTSRYDVIKQGILYKSYIAMHLFSFLVYLFSVSDKHNNIDLYVSFIGHHYMFRPFTSAIIRQDTSSPQEWKWRGLSLQRVCVNLRCISPCIVVQFK